MDFEVTMPRLGDEMIAGTIEAWLKEEGDTVIKNEPLFLVETGKVSLEVEAEASGTLKKILIPAGTENIPIGEVLAIIETAN